MKKKNTYISNSIFVLILLPLTILAINIAKEKNYQPFDIQDTKYENVVNKLELAAGNNSTITIKNIQNDNKDNQYSYSIKIDGVAGVIKYSINDKEDYIVFNAKGETTIQASGNDIINIYEIPYNTSYTIIQNEISNYKTQVNNTSTYKFSSTTNDINIVEFKNTNTEVSNNPDTSDNLIQYTIIAIAILVFLYLLKQCKIKKFTE